MSWSRIFIAVTATLSFGGCGYHLQSYDQMPSEMDVTYIQSSDHYSDFYRQLRQALENSNVKVTNRPADATATLIITNDITGQRLVTVSAQNQPLEFEVFYDVTFMVTTPDGVLLPEKELEASRTYAFNDTEILGKREEEAIIREALVRDMIRRVLRTLNAAGDEVSET